MELLPFFIVLMAGVLFAAAFRRFHLPWVLALITAGVVFGPSGFDFVSTNPTISFISQIGLILLMFMAGLETKLSSFKDFRHEVGWLALFNAGIPFIVGFGIGYIFEFSNVASLLLGVIFMSSSIAIVIPTLESAGLLNTKLGKSIVATTIIEDIASLVLLSIILQNLQPATDLPLYSFYFLLGLLLIGFRYALPKIREIIPQQRDESDLFESEVRIIMAMLIGVVVTFELLGLHPIIAGFFTGLVLSESITSKLLIDKLRTISYGIFIPVFFFVIGMETDTSVFFAGTVGLALIAAVIVGSVSSKLLSGWLGALAIGFPKKDALTIGIATIPQLSTTLAVVYTAVELSLLPAELVTAMVMLSIVTTIAAPLLLHVSNRG